MTESFYNQKKKRIQKTTRPLFFSILIVTLEFLHKRSSPWLHRIVNRFHAARSKHFNFFLSVHMDHCVIYRYTRVATDVVHLEIMRGREPSLHVDTAAPSPSKLPRFTSWLKYIAKYKFAFECSIDFVNIQWVVNVLLSRWISQNLRQRSSKLRTQTSWLPCNCL